MVINNTMISIEIVYADDIQQITLTLELAPGSTVDAALRQAQQQHTYFAQLDLTQFKVGIFSKIVQRETVLTAGDRIEIYLPLRIDPKQRRKIKAAQSAADN